MDITALRDEIKLQLTGYMIEMELDDPTLDKIINSALREMQRYICSTKLITVPFKKCIDLSDPKNTNDEQIYVNSVSRVFRAEGYASASTTNDTHAVDPLYASQWQLLSGTGNMQNFQDYVYNYLSWNTLLQIRNTTATDLVFLFDRESNKLYINISTGVPSFITIEYVPRYNSVEEIKSDYWIDILTRLSVAITKVTLGRIRTRYTQSNALWTQDGETMLTEGTTELTNLREFLQTNTQLVYPID